MMTVYIVMESFKEDELKGYVNSVMDSLEKAERKKEKLENWRKEDILMKGEYYKVWIDERIVE